MLLAHPEQEPEGADARVVDGVVDRGPQPLYNKTNFWFTECHTQPVLAAES